MKKLYKCRWNKKLFGVFGGLGQVFKIDPNILRITSIFLIIPTGIFVIPLIYSLLAIFIKNGPFCFIAPSYKRLYRKDKGKIFLGVFSGLSEYLGVDVILIRILAAVIGIISGFAPIIAAYIVAIFLIPIKPSN